MAECAELDLDLDLDADLDLDSDLNRLDLHLDHSLEPDDSKQKVKDRIIGDDIDLDLIRDSNRSALADCVNPESTNPDESDPTLAGGDVRCYNRDDRNTLVQSGDIARLQPNSECTDYSCPTPTSTDILTTGSTHALAETEHTFDCGLSAVTGDVKGNPRECAYVVKEEDPQNTNSNNPEHLIHEPAESTSTSLSCISNDPSSSDKSMKVTVAFEVGFSSNPGTDEPLKMPKKAKNSLQEAFLHFRKKRQVGNQTISHLISVALLFLYLHLLHYFGLYTKRFGTLIVLDLLSCYRPSRMLPSLFLLFYFVFVV